jgi:hypothetical protein
MNEGARWLRFLLPGAILEFVFGGWLYVDAQICNCYRVNVDVSSATALALIAAGALAFGFVCSVAASFIAWKARRGSRFFRGILRQWDDAAIVVRRIETLRALGIVPAKDALSDSGSIGASVTTDLAYHLLEGEPKYAAASQRMGRLLDLVNGLSNAVVAIAVGVLLVLVSLAVTSAMLFGASPDPGRVLWSILWLVAASLTGLLVMDSQRRVSDVCGEFLDALLASYKMNEDVESYPTR